MGTETKKSYKKNGWTDWDALCADLSSPDPSDEEPGSPTAPMMFRNTERLVRLLAQKSGFVDLGPNVRHPAAEAAEAIEAAASRDAEQKATVKTFVDSIIHNAVERAIEEQSSDGGVLV